MLSCLAICHFSSCALRLPEPSGPVRRVEVNRPPVQSVHTAAREPDVRIYLTATRIHTGVVLPFDWLVESGYRSPKNLGHPKYVAINWGDRTAYQTDHWLNPWQVFHAFVIGAPSVMEIIPFDWDVVDVCHHQRIYQRLVPRNRGPYAAAFLNHCARTDAAGDPVIAGPSSWGKGLLIDCRYNYYFPRICNVWTCQVLHACGVDVSPVRALAASWLIWQAESKRNGFEKIWNGD